MNEKIEKLEEIVSSLVNKEGTVYFFTLDTKDAPSGEVKYIYDLALLLREMGYDVKMLHQEEEFVGPLDWLGDKYAVIEHLDVKNDNVTVKPSDFLFIPEVFTNVIGQTKAFPCKRVMIYYNPSYFNDYMPVGATLADMNIFDIITTNENLKARINTYFPNVNVKVVRPSIREYFSNDNAPKKLIVNVLTPTTNEVNDIVKPFYWKYPSYKWISFRDLKGVTQSVLADVMREAAITVWADDLTSNAQLALEALKSGSLLIAKTPNTPPEWMLEEGEYRFGIIWVDSYDMLHDVLASVIRGWTRNEIIDKYLQMSDEVKNIYTEECQRNDVDKMIVNGIFEETINSYRQVLSAEKNKEVNVEE